MHPIYSGWTALSATLAHAGAAATPVPHWAVLLVGVVGLWVVIGSGVVMIEKLLAWLPKR
ncbi:hypothetical protein [Halococcus sediminicola]|uniref:hypothetical protein n=1 Tax=Halococcus sediminicola TaxID=1264579 RepID=UPI000679A921|nr:hypothetical protein [Halococcus sediminicola]